MPRGASDYLKHKKNLQDLDIEDLIKMEVMEHDGGLDRAMLSKLTPAQRAQLERRMEEEKMYQEQLIQHAQEKHTANAEKILEPEKEADGRKNRPQRKNGILEDVLEDILETKADKADKEERVKEEGKTDKKGGDNCGTFCFLQVLSLHSFFYSTTRLFTKNSLPLIIRTAVLRQFGQQAECRGIGPDQSQSVQVNAAGTVSIRSLAPSAAVPFDTSSMQEGTMPEYSPMLSPISRTRAKPFFCCSDVTILRIPSASASSCISGRGS